MSVTPVEPDAALLGGVGVEVALSLHVQNTPGQLYVPSCALAFSLSFSLAAWASDFEGWCYVPRRRRSWGLGRTWWWFCV